MGDPVARIISIEAIEGCVLQPSIGMMPGFFYPPTKKPPTVAGAGAPPVSVTRNGQRASGHVGMMLEIGDVARTSDKCICALEFVIGGRVGFNKGTALRIVTERAVVEVDVTLLRAVKRTGSIWLFLDNLREPIEIQTNGGIMGIRG